MKNQRLISEIVERLSSESGLILLHHNADVDAMGSAIALQSAFPNYSIGVMQKISQMSKKILTHFKDVEILFSPQIERFKNFIILDTSSPNQLGVSIEKLKNPIVIDHHKRNELWSNFIYYCDDTMSSCAEIIFDLLTFIKFKLTSKIALALSVAIIADTGHFKYANPKSLTNLAKILKTSNLKLADVLSVFDNSEIVDISQRIAHLKGGQRLRFRQSCGYLIAISQLSSFEASMCKHLIILGADVAFVGAQRDNEVRISGRASAELVNKGLHLGELFQSLGEELSCEGGGHAGAGGLNGDGDAELILNACLNKITEYLSEI